jgi:hypothetical protein
VNHVNGIHGHALYAGMSVMQVHIYMRVGLWVMYVGKHTDANEHTAAFMVAADPNNRTTTETKEQCIQESHSSAGYCHLLAA